MAESSPGATTMIELLIAVAIAATILVVCASIAGTQSDKEIPKP
jgi:Tfp pilus assembly protein FimT